ncbi:MAG: hypothetical protein AAFY03_11165 [Pseudomonadota bacterium]
MTLNRPEEPQNTMRPTLEDTAFCYKELLDRAFTGWEPTDQTLERIIDRVEHGR